MAASTYNNNGYITRICTENIPAGARIELSSGGCELADASNEAVGTCEQTMLSGQPITIRLFNTAGTRFGIANGAISERAVVYAGASGKLASTSTASATSVGIALSATSADGDVLEYLPTSLLG